MIKTSLILFFVFFAIAYGKPRPGHDDYGYEEEADGWMKLHETPATWKQAQETCVKEGAFLVDSEFEEVNSILVKIAKGSKNPIEYLYVGSQLSSAAANAVIGDVLPTCVVIDAINATKKGVPCSEEHPFICYAPDEDEDVDNGKEDVKEITDCDFKEAGQDREYWPHYNRCNEIGGWLKIHHDQKDHDSAKATCEKEGAKILDISDPKLKEIAIRMLKFNGTADNPLIVYGKVRLTFPTGGFKEVDGKNKFVKDLADQCTRMGPDGILNKKASCNETASVICFVEFPEDTCGGGEKREGHPDYKGCANITGWVKVHPEPADYDEAKENCAKEGAQLLDTSDPDFERIALEQVKRNSAIEPLVIFGKNKTVDGEKQTCSILYPNGTMEHNADCKQKVSYICYVPYPVTYDCGVEAGYRLGNDNETCYKLTTIGDTWDGSRAQCKADGGDLAVIKDAAEAEILKDIYAKHDSIFKAYFPLQVFVGVKKTEGGFWKTIDEETLAQAGYDKWAAGKPDNKLSDTPVQVKGISKTCGCINMQAQFVDCWCNLPQGYMCKKDSTKYILGKKVPKE